MSPLLRGKAVTTHVPSFTVPPGLAPGRHRFQLVVVDTAGNRSAADTVTVEIIKAPAKGHRDL
jgi:hypothetical protein